MKKRLPNRCPSCSRVLTVRRFGCNACGTTVEGEFTLPLLARLSPEDQAFVISLIKASGSLKQLASEYNVSYPTVRNRLDDLIDRIKALESETAEGGPHGNPA